MTVTLEVQGKGRRVPVVNREDVIVKQGKNQLQVADWTPARGDRAGLDLFILIDDASDTSVGAQLNDLRDETGGESFFLGLEAPVAFKPYLDQIQNILENQYLLTFQAKPGKKAWLQAIKLTIEIAGVEFASADSVWVPAAK